MENKQMIDCAKRVWGCFVKKKEEIKTVMRKIVKPFSFAVSDRKKNKKSQKKSFFMKNPAYCM